MDKDSKRKRHIRQKRIRLLHLARLGQFNTAAVSYEAGGGSNFVVANGVWVDANTWDDAATWSDS